LFLEGFCSRKAVVAEGLLFLNWDDDDLERTRGFLAAPQPNHWQD
jgi:hypothetical protein